MESIVGWEGVTRRPSYLFFSSFAFLFFCFDLVLPSVLYLSSSFIPSPSYLLFLDTANHVSGSHIPGRLTCTLFQTHSRRHIRYHGGLIMTLIVWVVIHVSSPKPWSSLPCALRLHDKRCGYATCPPASPIPLNYYVPSLTAPCAKSSCIISRNPSLDASSKGVIPK